MRWVRRTVCVCALAGCQEYNIAAPPSAFGEPNPVDLENPVNTDKIVQVTIPSVDVLWVVDNSGSMMDEQNDLTTNFPVFMDYFLNSGLDYHVGVTSTDLDGTYNGSKGKLVEANGIQWITPETQDVIGVFTAMASLGINGSGTERGIGATYMALETERDGANAGFFRDEASVHTVIISDEPDYTQDNIISDSEFTEWYKTLKLDAELRTFNVVVDPRPLFGVRYVAAQEAIGGIFQDIREEDWTNVLEQLGLQAAGLKSEYFLSKLPVPETITVRVELADGTVLPFAPEVDFTYDPSRNSITFVEYIPDPLSSVYIEYTVLASMVEVEEGE